MGFDKFRTADEAVKLIRDGDTVCLLGGGWGLLEATCLHAAVERRFLQTGSPKGLTVRHSLGIGDRKDRGLNRFAHEGMVKAVVGGHWTWSPRMQQLAREEKIEAYILPGGVMMQLYREIGAGRPGLFTHVGLGTVVDPRHGGGKMNGSARQELVEVVQVDGQELLRYKPFKVDVALIRASFADANGNLSMEQEPVDDETFALALAAHNSGGKVIAQVRTAVDVGTLPARRVKVPGVLVDAVVVDPGQATSYDIPYDPTLSGELRGPVPPEEPQPFSERQVVGRRGAEELFAGAVLNFGFGIPDAVAKVISARGEAGRYYQTVEHGTYDGQILERELFGFVRNASALIDAPSQFDFYGGGGLDLAYLGFGQIDAAGNVNVSKLAGTTVGPGGFIDIAQNAKKVVYVGTFDAKGTELEVGGGKLRIARHGSVTKMVKAVDQITFSGSVALRRRQEVIYVTERAVFELTAAGVELIEVAPGIDVKKDVLDRMEFAPVVRQPKTMNPAHFTA